MDKLLQRVILATEMKISDHLNNSDFDSKIQSEYNKLQNEGLVPGDPWTQHDRMVTIIIFNIYE